MLGNKMDFSYCVIWAGFHKSSHICDWASEKGPSGHIKFDHIFQLCSLITSDLFE